eukprot:5427009-Karenia_brevis.AAC.1
MTGEVNWLREEHGNYILDTWVLPGGFDIGNDGVTSSEHYHIRPHRDPGGEGSVKQEAEGKVIGGIDDIENDGVVDDQSQTDEDEED